MNQTQRRGINPIPWVLIGGVILLLVFLLIPRTSSVPEIEISKVFQMAEANQLAKIEVQGDKLKVITTAGETFKSRKESGVSVFELLKQRGISTGSDGIDVEVKSQGANFLGILITLLPLIIFGGLIFFLLRGARGGLNQALSISKSRAKVDVIERPTVTFDDVAGVEEAKRELAEIVEFLRYPEKFAKLGAKIPRGGAPGGPSGNGQDPAQQGGGRAGRRPLLLH